jgi:hypothetical protein
VHDLEHFAEDNQLGPEYFRAVRKPLDPAKLRFSTVLQQEIVDIEQNPCHLHIAGSLDLTAAWTNYVGREWIDLVGRERVSLLEFPVEWLSQELLRVTLFEDPFEARTPENVDRLWRFRRAMGVDEVAHRIGPATW